MCFFYTLGQYKTVGIFFFNSFKDFFIGVFDCIANIVALAANIFARQTLMIGKKKCWQPEQKISNLNLRIHIVDSRFTANDSQKQFKYKKIF